MTSPLESEIAALVYDAAAEFFFDATLTRDTIGTPTDAFDPETSDVTSTDYSCKAIEDTFDEAVGETTGLAATKGHLASTFAKVRKRRIIILTNSLSVAPQPNDRVTISGRAGTFTILTVSADPARATWTCEERT